MSRLQEDNPRSGPGASEPGSLSAPADRPGAGPRKHWLTFDVEEYFQVEAAARCVPRQDWPRRPRRLGEALERILALLAEFDTQATFFVLGWVARHEGELVRRIAAAGHEIASHGDGHRMLTQSTPEQFRRDLRDSRALLEDLAGQGVLGYRAPTFSIVRRTAWALDVLAEEGVRYDSSIFPVHHDRYGVPDAPVGAHWAVGPAGGAVLEIPPLTWRFLGTNWAAAGGGYLRLFPVALVGRALRDAARRGRGGMLYLHPWELDPGQPVLPMGRLGTFRHRVGLARTEGKLRWLLQRFALGDVRSSLARLEGETSLRYLYGAGAPSVAAEGGSARCKHRR